MSLLKRDVNVSPESLKMPCCIWLTIQLLAALHKLFVMIAFVSRQSELIGLTTHGQVSEASRVVRFGDMLCERYCY